MVAVREPNSRVILTAEERAAQMATDGAVDAEIAAAMKLRAVETMKRQTDYDKNPPSVAYRRVPN